MPEKNTSKKKSRIIWILVFIAVNAAVIGYTAVKEFGQKPAEKLTISFGWVNVLFLLGGIACMLLTLAIETIKYLTMMKALGVKVSFRAAFQTAALGKYYDNITPSGIGGQPFQIYNMHKEGYASGVSLAMPLTSFFTMQSGFVILAIAAFIFKGGVVDNTAMRVTAYIGTVCYMIAPAMILLFTIYKNGALKLLGALVGLGARLHILKKPDETLASVTGSLNDYREGIILMSKRRGLIAGLIIMSVIYQAAMMSIPFFVLMAFNGSAPFTDTLAMTVFIYCMITIIPTPGNSGAAEGSFYMIFSQLDPSGLFWSMLVWRAICYYAFILIGILIYAYNALKGRKRRASSAEGEISNGE